MHSVSQLDPPQTESVPETEATPLVSVEKDAASPQKKEAAAKIENSAKSSNGSGWETVVVYLVIFAFIGLVNTESRQYMIRYRWQGLIAAAVVLLSLALFRTSQWYKKQNFSGRTGMLVFGILPAVIIAVGGAIFLSPFQVNVMRLLFLAVVILLPGVLFYLFIANRKASLLNEFVANLNQLGIIGVHSQATSLTEYAEQFGRSLRFQSYRRKFEAVYGRVSDQSIQEVFKGYQPADNKSGQKEIKRNPPASSHQSEEVNLTSETGIPIVIATLLIALGWLLALSPKSPGGAVFDLEKSPINFAFLGAYFFSLQMLFRRYVLRDLRPSAYISVSLRIILAVIGTSVFVAAAGALKATYSESAMLVIGFAIGVFPPIIWQFVQSVFKKLVGARFFLPSLRSQLPISDLDGLTVWHEARLEEEGIENIPNMATADIVELMVQTRLTADQIIDWVDQAILYTCLGPDDTKSDDKSPRRRLRAHGIRTATSLLVAYQKCRNEADCDSLEKVLSLAGAESGRSPMRALVAALTTNTNLELVRTWKGISSQ